MTRFRATIRHPKASDAILAYVALHNRLWIRRIEAYMAEMHGFQPAYIYRLVLRMDQQGMLRYKNGMVTR